MFVFYCLTVFRTFFYNLIISEFISCRKNCFYFWVCNKRNFKPWLMKKTRFNCEYMTIDFQLFYEGVLINCRVKIQDYVVFYVSEVSSVWFSCGCVLQPLWCEFKNIFNFSGPPAQNSPATLRKLVFLHFLSARSI